MYSGGAAGVRHYSTNQVVGTFSVGPTPLAGAMSMDNNWLYVTCSGNSTLAVIDLNRGQVTQTVALSSAPQGVEVGADGRALISMNMGRVWFRAFRRALWIQPALRPTPLLSTSSGQIQAQVPVTMLPGAQVVEVRSLATAQDSAPVVITVASGN